MLEGTVELIACTKAMDCYCFCKMPLCIFIVHALCYMRTFSFLKYLLYLGVGEIVLWLRALAVFCREYRFGS